MSILKLMKNKACVSNPGFSKMYTLRPVNDVTEGSTQEAPKWFDFPILENYGYFLGASYLISSKSRK